MLIRVKDSSGKYNTIMIAYILIIIIILFVVDILAEKFLIKKEVEKFEAIQKGIAKNILDTENRVEERLKIATILLEKYLKEEPILDRHNLINFTKIANVDRATLHSTDGKKVLGSSSDILENPIMIEKMKNYNLLDRVVDQKQFLSNNNNIVIFPMGRDTVTGSTSKPIVKLSKPLNMIMSCAIEVGISDIIKSNIELNHAIEYISVSTPSGILFADSKHSINAKVPSVEKYNDKVEIIENEKNNIVLRLSFGGLQKENAIRIIDKTVNSKNEYFYILSITFSKQQLNQQILFLRLSLSIIGILVYGVAYFIKKTFQ